MAEENFERISDPSHFQKPTLDQSFPKKSSLCSSGEFAALPFHEADSTLCTAGLKNMHKNRYTNILPPDSTRVHLADESYINANLIDLGGETSMIACQGPLESTIEDFFRMILQYHAPAILMMTPLVEQQKVKCVKYWPEPGQTACYGNLRIYNLGSNKIIDNLTVSNLLIYSIQPGTEQLPLFLHHIHYSGIPDFGTADLDEIHLVLCLLISVLKDSKPFVCHCSAGVGRTGIVATIIRCIRTREPPVTAILNLRVQRHGMVQKQKTISTNKRVSQSLIKSLVSIFSLG